MAKLKLILLILILMMSSLFSEAETSQCAVSFQKIPTTKRPRSGETIVSAFYQDGYERLDKTSLAMLLGGSSSVEGTGGCSCGATGSSCGCDATAVCNCPPPKILFPTKPTKS